MTYSKINSEMDRRHEVLRNFLKMFRKATSRDVRGDPILLSALNYFYDGDLEKAKIRILK
jgi:hypothetical protein